jgi:hypothetical protein
MLCTVMVVSCQSGAGSTRVFSPVNASRKALWSRTHFPKLVPSTVLTQGYGGPSVSGQETHIGRRAQKEKWSSTSGVTLKCGERLCSREAFIFGSYRSCSSTIRNPKVLDYMAGAYQLLEVIVV